MITSNDQTSRSEKNGYDEVVGLRNTIVQIVSGTDHVLALDKRGIVYAWGANNFGQLGIGNLAVRQLAPSNYAMLDHLKRDPICQIYAGANCSFAVSIKGQLYCWGDVTSPLSPSAPPPRDRVCLYLTPPPPQNRNFQLGIDGSFADVPTLLDNCPWDLSRDLRVVVGKDNTSTFLVCN